MTIMKNNASVVNEIKRMSSRYPKTIKEALDFNALENESDDDVAYEKELAEKKPKMELPKQETVDIASFVASMRKQSLEVMRQLADTPDDPVYEFSKRIFQLAEKAYADSKGVKNPADSEKDF